MLTAMPLVRRAGHGAEGFSPRCYVAASSLGPKTLKSFTVFRFSCLVPEHQTGIFRIFFKLRISAIQFV